jgi:dihydrofolate reductase
MKISLVVAAAENNAIGKDDKLLWSLPRDMQYFKQITMGHCVLMGRKTYETIPEKFRPLAGRVNIVVTRNADFKAPGCRVVKTVEEGIRFAEANDEDELMVIGGGEIYRQMYDRADRIYLTKVHYTFADADTYFPEIVKAKWETVFSEMHLADDRHTYDFEFVVMEKAKAVVT